MVQGVKWDKRLRKMVRGNLAPEITGKKSNVASEILTCMCVHDNKIYVAGGNKIWVKYPNSEEFIQAIFVNGEYEKESK